ncbi:MAG: BREX-1 system phosphatase PglZ type B [Gammaproteobacteria bacterium]|nr:BREX-1 system phosphatase PglZ type B [Gammaproteobacteria bacterium]
MKIPLATAGATVLETLVESLAGAERYNPNDAVAPAAILWTDRDAQWRSLVPRLREMLPQLLVFDVYAPMDRTGPAIWLRTVVDGTLPDAGVPEGVTPLLYLPGVDRMELRAETECREELRPLIELQYRGTCWTQRNGRDWTVEAFLVSSDGGLGLDLRRDAATRTSMLGALGELADTPVHRLRGKHLEREDFDRLLLDDLPRDLLRWMNEPSDLKPAWNPGRWAAFGSRCREELGLDPEKEGVLVAAERLGKRLEPWDAVWSRFAESPSSYPQVIELLRRAKPPDLFENQSPSWPQNNEAKESELRKSLVRLGAKAPADATAEIRELEKIHGPRRDWVWAKLGQAHLAQALGHLNRLAEAASTNLGGGSLAELADQYTAGGYEIDDAALAAAAAVKGAADFDAVTKALDAVYRPWLESAARQLQALAEEEQMPLAEDAEAGDLAVDAGGVILFADGLRFDVSRRLVVRMLEAGLEPRLSWRWAGLPTVTATAKPAVSPVIGAIAGMSPGDAFLPVTADGGQPLTTDRFRKLLSSSGYEVLSPGETGDPAGLGWTEDGNLDKLGHDLKGRLAGQVEGQVELLLERVQTLLAAGWRMVRIVTDHGWLWLPGGLPKVDLPYYLAESRWARCAAVKGDSTVDVPTTPWYWNGDERVALAPGTACFKAGHEYAHGGLSPQESIVPVVTVAASPAGGRPVTIEAISWAGMRCRVHVDGDGTGLRIELRTRVNDDATALGEARVVDSVGNASLLVEDEDREGTSAVVVALDVDGQPVTQMPTIVGGQ